MARKSKNIKERDRFIIVCGAEETEPNYFKNYKELMSKVGDLELEIIKESKSPTYVLDKAVELKGKFDNINQIWCVFDKDDFSDFDNVIERARKSGIKTAYSNEAFEIWFIFHYEYTTGFISRYDYKEKLNRYFGKEYKKNDRNLFEMLLEKQENAINNAKKVYQYHRRDNKKPSNSNPETTVFELIEEINRWIGK
jgi:hypothetical protein